MSDTTPRGTSPGTGPAPDLNEVLSGGRPPADPDDIDELAEEDTGDAPELDIEAPEADAAEQQTEVRQHHDEPISGNSGYDANPADAREQKRVVDLDEDDYR